MICSYSAATANVEARMAGNPNRFLWLKWAVILFAFYLALVDKTDWQEMTAGVLCMAVAALAVTVTAVRGDLHFQPRFSWLAVALRLPWRILADCSIVLGAICGKLVGRQQKGAFRVVPFDAGGPTPVDAARRALATGGVSIAPNTYVVAIDEKRNVLLVHQLVPSAQPPGHGDKEWPL